MINIIFVGPGYRQADIEESIMSIPSPDSLVALVREFQAEVKRSVELQGQVKGFNL
jgi:hypothetical protein